MYSSLSSTFSLHPPKNTAILRPFPEVWCQIKGNCRDVLTFQSRITKFEFAWHRLLFGRVMKPPGDICEGGVMVLWSSGNHRRGNSGGGGGAWCWWLVGVDIMVVTGGCVDGVAVMCI